jgi:hypothetical protein
MEEIEMSNLSSIKTVAPTVELGGKIRTIQFDMNAYSVLEERYGSVDAAMSQLEKGKIKDLGTMLWVGLIHEEITSFDEDTGEPTGYNVTPFQVRSWVNTPILFEEVSKKLGQALGSGLPVESDVKEEIKNI